MRPNTIKDGVNDRFCTCKIKVDAHKSVGVYFYFTGARIDMIGGVLLFWLQVGIAIIFKKRYDIGMRKGGFGFWIL